MTCFRHLVVPLAMAAIGAVTAWAQPDASKAGGKWVLRYEHDVDNESLELVDLQFPSAQRGIAVGLRTIKTRTRPVALVTSNGGKTWEWVNLDAPPVSLFFLDDSTGWVVTTKGLYQTVESGRSWKKQKAPKDILRVYFQTPERGWAIGLRKAFYETSDGGASWRRVEAAEKPEGRPEYTFYSWMTFANPKYGVVVGSSRPPRPGRHLPIWLDPEGASRRRELPALTIMLQTSDGGNTWQHSVASLFGQITRLRVLGPRGLGLFEFQNRFVYPSEVVRVDMDKGKSETVFHRKDRAVTDVIAFPDGTAYLAGYEPVGEIAALPVPGKLRMLTSTDPDWKHWVEMPADYRAVANRVVLAASDADNVWAATDTGMILKLEKSAASK